MSTMTVTARGQVTFRKEVLQHLGIRAGEKIELELLPNGQATLRASRPTGSIEDFIGLMTGKSSKVATLEDIEEATIQGWSGLVK